MPSLFSQLQADMAAIVADEFGEPTTITFVDPGSPYVIEPDSGTFDAIGAVSMEDTTFDRVGSREIRGAVVKAVSAEVRYSLAALATAPRKPKSGDKIMLTSREELPLFRVSDGRDNGRGRWVCILERT